VYQVVRRLYSGVRVISFRDFVFRGKFQADIDPPRDPALHSRDVLPPTVGPNGTPWGFERTAFILDFSRCLSSTW